MARFKKYLFEKLLTSSGYVLDFTNMTFASFIEESVGVDIYSNKYDKYGGSKGKRLKAFFDVEDNLKVGKLLNDMLKYYSEIISDEIRESEKDIYEQCKKEIEKLLGGAEIYTDKLNFVEPSIDLTIRELKKSIENDLNNRRFNVALDRLHTYCIKYFRTKAIELEIEYDKNKPLHSIAGEVVKVINIHQSEMTIKILRSSLSVLDNFNKVRNEQSLAHDNDILENNEARLIVEWIIGLLNFFDECFERYKNKVNEIIVDDIPF